MDRDEPPGGHRFFFTLAPESSLRANFSVRDSGGELFPFLFSFLRLAGRAQSEFHRYPFYTDNTASIYTRRSGFRRAQQGVHLVAVVISDSGVPMMSSTSTLTVRVCTCDQDRNMEMCNAEALSGTAGLSTGALVAILLCVLILLCKCLMILSSVVGVHSASTHLWWAWLGGDRRKVGRV